MPEDPPVSVSSEQVEAAPRRTGRWRIDLILALTAIFLSVISLYVAVENATTQRQMLAASTWPMVGIGLNNNANDKGDIVLSVGNSGVGPAKLQSFEVFYKGRPVSTGIALLQRCCGLSTNRKALGAAVTGHMFASVVDGIVLKAGDDVPFLTVRPDPANPALAQRLVASLSDLTFRGCYCSVLDECWVSNLSSTRVTKVRECPVPEHPFNPGGQ